MDFRRNIRGFSLTEMSIVIASAAAIVAVVVAGAGLIKKSRLTRVIEDINVISRAVSEFEQLYGGLPGDLADVSALPSANPAPVAGNGNGVIDAGEELQFWRQLSIAGLIAGNYDGTSANSPGVGVPEGSVNGSGYRVVTNPGNDIPKKAIVVELSGYSSLSNELPALTAEELKNLDTRVDDGRPSFGILRGKDGSGVTGGDCVANNDYTTPDNEVRACVARFVFRPGTAIGGTNASLSCGNVGDKRISPDSSCPSGYTGYMEEICTQSGSWSNPESRCEAVTCIGDKSLGETKTLACPEGYSGTGQTLSCSASGIWDITDSNCTVLGGPCTNEGVEKILACLYGETGKVTMTCTSGNWVINNTCSNITCGASILGVTRTGIANGAAACSAGGYYSGDVTETCTMIGWKATSNSCKPVYGNCTYPEADTGVGDNKRDIGCPPGEAGNFIQYCLDNGANDNWAFSSNTCAPVKCGEENIGAVREAEGKTCGEGQAGTVYEVCDVDGSWAESTLNCTNSCSGTKLDGSLDTTGNATWPSAAASSTVDGICVDGYIGQPKRSCNADGEWADLTPGDTSLTSCSDTGAPIPLANLELWVDADDLPTLYQDTNCTTQVSADNQTALCWKDKSGNVRNLKTSIDTPRYQTNVIGGTKPIVEFSGGTDRLDYSTAVPISFPSVTYFDVLRVNNTTNNYLRILNIKSSGGLDYNKEDAFSFQVYSTDGQYSLLRSTGADGLSIQGAIPAGFNIYTILIDSTVPNSGNAYVYVNGALSGQDTYSNTNPIDINEIRVNNDFGGGSIGVNDHGEMILYSAALSDTNRKLVETYLSNKWGIPVNHAENCPQAAANCTLWLDADDPKGIGSDKPTTQRWLGGGEAVDNWQDKSGSGHTVTQATASYKPEFVRNAKNSKPVLRFDGMDDYLAKTSVVGSTLSAADQISIFVTYNPKSPLAGSSIVNWVGPGPSSYPNRINLHAPYSDGMIHWDFGNNNYDRISVTPTGFVDNWNILTALKRTDDTMELRINGSSVQTGSSKDNDLDTAMSRTLYIAINNGNIEAKTDLAEILMYNIALASNQVRSVESYLGGKWGIELSGCPTGIEGCVLWVDASDNGSMYTGNDCSTGQSPADGIGVGCIKDKSGSGNHAVQSIAGSKPLYKATIQNGKSILRFDGTDDYLRTSSTLNPKTLFLVHKSDSLAASDYLFDFRPVISNSFAYNVSGTDLVGSNWPTYYTNGTDKGVVFSGNFQISTFYGTSSLSDEMNIGARQTLNETMQGDIAEILVYNVALSETDRKTVEGYLREKWGTGGCPADVLGCSLWFDASDDYTIFTDTNCTAQASNGNSVACWKDKSGNDYNVTQSTSAKQPTKADSALTFNGSDQNLINTNFADIDYVSIFSAAKTLSSSNEHQAIIHLSVAGNHDSGSMLAYDGGGTGNLYFFRSFDTALGQTTYLLPVPNTVILSAIADGSTLKLYEGGTLKSSTNHGSIAHTVNKIMVGELENRTIYGFEGDMYEIVAYPFAVTDAQRTAVEKYLADKWNISLTGCPAGTTGCTLWFDADDATTLFTSNDCITGGSPSNGNAIGCWKDKSGNDVHVTQSNSSNRPDYVTSGQNGKAILRFTNSESDSMSKASVVGTDIFSANEGTLFFTQKYNGPAHYSRQFLWAGASGMVATHSTYSDGKIYWDFGSETSTGRTSVTPILFNDTWNVITLLRKTDDTHNIFINGSSITTTSGKTATVNPAESTTLYIYHLLDGDAGELIYYKTALSDSNRKIVENYLTNKWGINASCPASTTDCTLWLDANDSATTFTDSTCTTAASTGNTIGCWKDKSGNNIHMLQGTASNEPSYVASGLNSKPIMSFDGTDYFGTSSAIPGGAIASSDEITIFVTYIDKSPVAATSVLAWMYSSDTSYINIHGLYSNNVFYWDFGTDTYDRISFTPSGFLDVWRIITTMKRPNDTMEIWFNGVSQLTGSSKDNDLNTSLTASLYLGKFVGSTAMNMDASEVLIYKKALTETDRKAVETYLGDKWGIAVPHEGSCPEDVNGCRLWIDAAYAKAAYSNTGCTLLANDGEAVGCVKDRSPTNATPLVVGTVTYHTNVQNGKPVLRFGATSNDYIRYEHDIDIGDQVTLFTVARNTNNTGGKHYLLVGEPTGGDTTTALEAYMAYDSVGVQNNNQAGGISYTYGDLNKIHLMSFTRNKYLSTPKSRLYVDGVLRNSADMNDFIYRTKWLLGRRAWTNDNNFKGDMSEVIVYDIALNDDSRKKIESYLMDKWGIPLLAACPADVEGCTLWLDVNDNNMLFTGDDCSTGAAPAAASAIGCVKDKSGKGNNATQSTTSAKPLYSTNAINAKSVLYFDSNDSFNLATPSNLGIQNSDYEIFAVARTSNSSTQYLLAGAASKYELSIDNSSGFSIVPDGASTNATIGSTGDYVDGKPYIFSAKIQQDYSYVGINGVYATLDKSGARSSDNTALVIGKKGDGSSDLEGDIAEMIIYGKLLTDTERSSILNYLGNKWDIMVEGCPADVPNCILWLDASDTNSIFTDTNCLAPASDESSVACWKDKSGKGYNVTQGTGSLQPSYDTTGFNSKASIKFDGTGDYLKNAAFKDMSYATAFAVSNAETGDNTQGIFTSGTGTCNSGFAILPENSLLYARNNDGSADNASFAQSLPVKGIMSIKVDGSNVTNYFNSKQRAQTASGATTGTLNEILIGALAQDGGCVPYTLKGTIAEFSLYDRALTDVERVKIDTYLADKWDISLAGCPEGVADCKVWLDASDANTIFTDSSCTTAASSGNNVGCWQDKSGNNNDLTQTTSSKQPYYNAASGSTKANVSFEGNDYLQGTGQAIDDDDKTISIIAAIAPDYAHTGVIFGQFEDGNDADTTSYTSHFLATNTNGVWFDEYGPSGGSLGNNAGYTPYSPSIIKMIVNNAYRELSIDGNVVSDNSSETYSSSEPTVWRIGSRPYGPSLTNLNGDVYEMVVYDKALLSADAKKIEDYLADKWGVIMKGNCPANVPNCIAWYDAADDSTLFTDSNCTSKPGSSGATIGCWKDKSGNGYNVTMTNSAKRPSWGVSSVKFDGADKYMWTYFTDIDNVSIFSAVYTAVSSNTHQSIIHIADEGNVNSGALLFYYNGGNNTDRYYFRTFDTAGQQAYFGMADPNRALLTAIADGVNIKLYEGGVFKHSLAHDYIAHVTDIILIGEIEARTIYGFQGEMYEIVVYPYAVSDAQRVAVEQYLANKWNFELQGCPAGIDGCVAWLDGADSSTVFTDTACSTFAATGNNIGCWKDKSGKGNDITQATASKQPVFVSNGLGGKTTVSFEGDDYLRRNAQLVDDDDYSISVIALIVPDSAHDGVIFGQFEDDNDSDTTSYTSHFFITTSTGAALDEWQPLGGQLYNTTGYVASNPSIFRLVINSPYREIAINGNVVSDNSAETYSSTEPTYWRIGSRPYNTGSGPKFLNGDVAEFIAYDVALSTENALKVEAYLADKWGIGSCVDVMGCKLWLDASDIDGDGNTSDNPPDGTKIAKWFDKSGNELNVEQTTSANQPTLKTNVTNGASALLLDGTDYMTKDNVAGSKLASAEGVTLIFSEYYNAPNHASSILHWFNESSGNRLNMHAVYSSGALYWDFGEPHANNRISGTPSNFVDKWNIISGVHNADDTNAVYINGTLFISGSSKTASFDVTDSQQLQIGAYIGSTFDGRLNAYIGEILLYDHGLSTMQRSKVESYLGAKYGVGECPAGVPDCILWLDADDNTTLFSDNTCSTAINAGDAVGCWKDKSFGTKYDVVQATSTARPIYMLSSNFSSKPGVRFDGSDDYLRNTAFKDISYATTFAVTNMESGDTSQGVFEITTGTCNTGISTWAATDLYARNYDGALDSAGFAISHPVKGIMGLKVDGTNVTNYLNGAQRAQVASGANSSVLDEIYVGSLPQDGGGCNSYVLKGTLVELAVYERALSDSERKAVEQYLAEKWEIGLD